VKILGLELGRKTAGAPGDLAEDALSTQRGRSTAGTRSNARGRSTEGGPAHTSVTTLTIRVAMAAAAVVGSAYLLIAVLVAMVVSGNLISDVDSHLQQALNFNSQPKQPPADQGGGGPGGLDPGRLNPRGVPLLIWKVTSDGTITSQGLTNVDLPQADSAVTTPTTVSIDGVSYRLAGLTVGSDHFVAGQALDGVSQTQSTLLVAEFGIGCALLIFVFLGSLIVGRRVALPIERTRQRQLEFTADASHELRTPLSVIEAQTSLALARKRDTDWDETAFKRIDGELKRTRHLLDDMLWLARFDSAGSAPDAEPVDVAVLAAATVDRFAAVAEARDQMLAVDAAETNGAGAIVTVPPEWLDRLLGVLLDNACKFSPQGGRIAVSVAAEGKRVRLSVDDSGPGIPPEQRDRVFDRFHRASDSPGGAGLGLAIADAIVRATGGRWTVAESPLGGASVSVTWSRSMNGDREGREP
jgi:two-component system sensor histidine kinase CiaH